MPCNIIARYSGAAFTARNRGSGGAKPVWVWSEHPLNTTTAVYMHLDLKQCTAMKIYKTVNDNQVLDAVSVLEYFVYDM